MLATEADKYIPENLHSFGLDEYQDIISTFDQSGLESYGDGQTPLWYYMLGLAGEAGEFAEKIYDGGWVAFELGRELGDVLWYAVRAMARLGFHASDVLGSQFLHAYQVRAGIRCHEDEPGARRLTIGLSAHVGKTVDKVKKLYRNGQTDKLSLADRKDVADRLAEVVEFIARAAALLNISLAEVAKWNIEKLADRSRRNVIRSEGDNR